MGFISQSGVAKIPVFLFGGPIKSKYDDMILYPSKLK